MGSLSVERAPATRSYWGGANTSRSFLLLVSPAACMQEPPRLVTD